MDRVRLEIYAARLPIDSGHSVGASRAELIRRDRKYTEEQECSRRKFETELVDRQLAAATAVANATRWAMWAASFSAGGAVVTAIVEVMRLALGR